MITDPTTIPNCFVWLDASDPSTMFQTLSTKRRNILSFSVDLDRWSISTNTSVSSERFVLSAPNGLSGTRIIRSVSTLTNPTSTNLRSISTTATLQASSYTFSVFLRPYNSSQFFGTSALSAVTLSLTNADATYGASCSFQLSGLGSLSADTLIGLGGVSIPPTASITLSSDNWYLCTLTAYNSATNAVFTNRIRIHQDGILAAYGAQLELSATRTDYLFKGEFEPLPGSNVTQANNLVAFWKDKTNSKRDFTTAFNANTTRPSWISSLSALRFDGDDFFTSYFDKKYIDGQTIFMVTSRGAFGDRYMFDQRCGETYSTNNSLDPNVLPLYSYTSNHVRQYGWNGNATTIGSWQYSFPRLTSYIDYYNKFSTYCSWFSGNRMTLLVDGMYQAVQTGTYNGSGISSAVDRGTGLVYTAPGKIYPSANVTTIGAGVRPSDYAITYHYIGDVCEVIIYDRGLTHEEIQSVNYYLANKWKHLSLAKTLYAVKNGDWTDPTTWNINSEPWINTINKQDNVFTNGYEITASNVDIFVNTLASHCPTPSLFQGGTFLMSSTVNLTAGILGSNAGTAYSSFTVSVSSGPNNVLNYYGPRMDHQRCIITRPDSKMNIFGPCSVNYTDVLTTAVGSVNSIYGGTGACVVTTVNNTIVGNRLTTAGRYEQHNAVSERRHTYAFDLSGVNNTLVVNNSTLYSGRGGETRPGASIACRLGQHIRSNVCILSSCYIERNVDSTNDNWANAGVPVVFTSGNLQVYNSVIVNNRFTNYNLYTPTFCLSGTSVGYFENNRYVGPSPTSPGTNYYNRNISPCVAVIGSNFGQPSLTVRLSSGNNITPSVWSPIIYSTSTTPVSVYTEEPILNDPAVGRQTINARFLKLFPTGNTSQYTRQVNNNGDYVYFWKDTATFDYPSQTDVVLDTTYNNQTLTGTSILPPASAVYFGVPIGPPNDIRYGTATFDPKSVLSVPLSTSLSYDSIGSRLKYATTNQILTSMVEGFVFA